MLILDPPTRRRRCYLSTFSVAPCTADYGTAVRAVAGRGLGTGYCDNSLTYTPPRNRTRCARRVLLRRPVVEPLQLCHKLLPASRSDTDLCSNCLVLWSARYVLHFEQEIHYHRRLSHLAVHSHYSPDGFSGLVAAMLTRYTDSLRSSAGLPCARLRQHSVAVGVSGQESVAM